MSEKQQNVKVEAKIKNRNSRKPLVMLTIIIRGGGELQGHRVAVGSKKSMNIRREYSTCQATAIFMYITVIEP